MEQDRQIENEEQHSGQRRADTMSSLSGDADAAPRTRALAKSADQNANSQSFEAGISGSTMLSYENLAIDGRHRKRLGRFSESFKKKNENNEALEKRTSNSSRTKVSLGSWGKSGQPYSIHGSTSCFL